MARGRHSLSAEPLSATTINRHPDIVGMGQNSIHDADWSWCSILFEKKEKRRELKKASKIYKLRARTKVSPFFIECFMDWILISYCSLGRLSY
jgi:hypothetical protein